MKIKQKWLKAWYYTGHLNNIIKQLAFIKQLPSQELG